MKYEFCYHVTADWNATVEANSEEEARAKAQLLWPVKEELYGMQVEDLELEGEAFDPDKPFDPNESFDSDEEEK
jgi:hypothetical protein